MTDDDWNRCDDPQPMLRFLRGSGRATDRKLRLFACGCCRRIWDRLPDPCNRDLVAAVEDHPDGGFSDPDLEAAIVASSRREYEFSGQPAYWAAKYLGRGFYKLRPFDSAVVVALRALSTEKDEGGRRAEASFQADLLRCIFGRRPFRPVAVQDAWVTWNGGTVRRLAESMYDRRAFEELGVLADALQDAGCHDGEILAHCRGPGPHARGCWVLDLLLGNR